MPISLTPISPAISFDQPIARAASATTAEIDGQLVALDIETGTCFGLNRAATRMWNLIENPASARAISAALLDHYDVPPETCAAQTLELLSELVEIGLARPALS